MSDPLYDSERSLLEFWSKQRARINQMNSSTFREANRHQELPIARIKKIMKIEDGVKLQMISAEAPILLAKASELLIEELTLRAWIHTQENRRKTIQKSDIATAVSRCEMFDFLIDIVPREEIVNPRQSNNSEEAGGEKPATQQIQYIVQYNGDDQTDEGSSLMQLENGQIIQATQIGPSIPLTSDLGQQVVTIPSSTGEQQFKFLSANNQSNQLQKL